MCSLGADEGEVNLFCFEQLDKSPNATLPTLPMFVSKQQGVIRRDPTGSAEVIGMISDDENSNQGTNDANEMSDDCLGSQPSDSTQSDHVDDKDLWQLLAFPFPDDEDDLMIVIQDSGEGMTDSTQYRIFERFYQEDESRSTSGIGLGLSITHRIIELHKGTIEVESELDAGSRFLIRLPVS